MVSMKTEEGNLNMLSKEYCSWSNTFPKTRTVTRKCEESGVEFELEQSLFGDTWFPEIKYCDAVLEKHMEAERKERLRIINEEKKAKVEKWIKDNIPPYFQEELNSKYDLDWNAMDKVKKYDPDQQRSLVLKGSTRRGKTRAMYEICKKHANLFPVVFTAERLARMLGGCLSESASKHEKALQGICRAKLVCIDDLGKESVTPRTQADLFEIINYRIEHKLPTIITTNFDSKGLDERFKDKDLSAPLIARIGEFKVIQFSE